MRRPRAKTGIGVLVVPAFAEEMNKSRRMLADVGRALQARGLAMVVVDPYGTGDSEGEFRDATCARWIEDLAQAASWAAAEGWPISRILCVRLGSLLGAWLAREALHGVQRTVFWQPILDGERFVRYFLRLRVAALMMEGASASVSGLQQSLRDGQCVEVAGYDLSPHLAAELVGLRLYDLLDTRLGALHCIEVIRGTEAATAAASEKCIEIARSRGLHATVRTVVGEPFWSSIETVRIRELVDCTVDALTGSVQGPESRAGSSRRVRQ
jgi:exosortase A-associated hydrolase 2